MKVITCLVLCFFASLVLCLSAQADPRAWGENGIPIRQGYHLKWNQGMARDASGNTLLVWTDKSTGQRDVRAQLINSAGEEQWTTGGVNVTPELHFQDCPVAVSVAGGWIIAWADYRDTTGCNGYYYYFSCPNVFAQKLDYSGNRLWPENDFTGVAVQSESPGIDKFSLRIERDASGGAIIAWNGTGNLYAQRVTTSGIVAWPQAVQVADSFLVYELQTAPGLDGSMLVAWDTYGDYSIYVTRVMPDGTLPWGANGMPVRIAAGTVVQIKIAPDGSDGCYLAWSDARVAGGIYVQHLQSSGQPLWAVNGIPVSTTVGWDGDPDIGLSSDAGEVDGMLAVWSHSEQSGGYSIRAQRVSPDGTFAWPAGGLVVTNLDQNAWNIYPTVTTDHNGGLVTVWANNAQGYQRYYFSTRLRSDGTFAWGSNPVQIGGGSGYQAPVIRGDFGSYFVAYVTSDTAGLESMHYQILDHANGSRLLGLNGLAAASGIGGNAYTALTASLSGNRTAIFWYDWRNANYMGGLFYQVVAPSGDVERTANGEPLVSNNSGYPYGEQRNPRTCDDGNGGLFVSYEDNRSGTHIIRVSHISSSGEVVGPDSGAIVWWQQGMFDQQDAYLCSDGEGGCYVAWSQYEHDYSLDAYVMQLNSGLQRVWDEPTRLTASSADDIMYGLVSAAGNRCIAVWQSGAWTNFNVSAAGICADGTIAWNDTLCAAPGDQSDLVAVSDGTGGAYIVWDDSRTEANDQDIYAQRVGADGTHYWDAGGIPIYAGPGSQSGPRITLDSGGDLSAIWFDYRGDSAAVYAQRLSPGGNRLWGNGGVPIVHKDVNWRPDVIASSRAGIFPVWGEYLNNESNVFATHLDSTGALFNDPFWRPDSGGAVAEREFEHEMFDSPYAASDGWGGCVVSWNKWEDEYEYGGDREGGEIYTADIFAQHIFDYPNKASGQNEALPRRYALYQNYPNPFNPITEIWFDLPRSGKVKLMVYDLLGRQVATLADNPMIAGQHQIPFDASALASGIYFYRIEAEHFTQSKKMVLLK